VLPRGLHDPARAEHESRPPPSPTPPPRSASQPGPRAPSAGPRLTPGARPSPGPLRSHLQQSVCPAPRARPAQPGAGTPANRCRSAGPRQGRRGHRTGPCTSYAQSSADRGGRTSPELGPPAPVTSGQGVEESKVRKRADAETTRENFEFDDKNTHLNNPPRETCHNACSVWASLKWAGGALACSRPCSGRATVTSGVGRAPRDDEALTLCVGCLGTTQLSSPTTSTPAAGSGAGAGQFSH
jgi:hypothetical protein